MLIRLLFVLETGVRNRPTDPPEASPKFSPRTRGRTGTEKHSANVTLQPVPRTERAKRLRLITQLRLTHRWHLSFFRRGFSRASDLGMHRPHQLLPSNPVRPLSDKKRCGGSRKGCRALTAGPWVLGAGFWGLGAISAQIRNDIMSYHRAKIWHRWTCSIRTTGRF
jgi:hypothetical protein